MKLATFKINGTEHAGICENGGYYTFQEILGENAPKTMLDFIRNHENIPLPKINLTKKTEQNVTLLAPIPNPFRDVICIGKNYADHAKEIAVISMENPSSPKDFVPKAPVYFPKTAVPPFAHGDKIPLHSHLTQKVDYEAELAVIIGKTIYNISPEEVENAIFGYTILNDLTARDLQIKHGQWFFGKSLDGFCPMGPHIVTKDEIPFPVSLDISCRVNGETRQFSNTSNLIFSISHIISEISGGITLHPGDIIATGTPAGVGHAMIPPQYLKSGDKVECEIEKIGVLANYF